jgi:hypothetical protein
MINMEEGYSEQAGSRNYMDEDTGGIVNGVPRKWKSAPDHPETMLVYITHEEAALLVKSNLHNSPPEKMPGEGRGPGGVPSYNGDSYGGSFGSGTADSDSDAGESEGAAYADANYNAGAGGWNWAVAGYDSAAAYNAAQAAAAAVAVQKAIDDAKAKSLGVPTAEYLSLDANDKAAADALEDGVPSYGLFGQPSLSTYLSDLHNGLVSGMINTGITDQAQIEAGLAGIYSDADGLKGAMDGFINGGDSYGSYREAQQEKWKAAIAPSIQEALQFSKANQALNRSAVDPSFLERDAVDMIMNNPSAFGSTPYGSLAEEQAAIGKDASTAFDPGFLGGALDGAYDFVSGNNFTPGVYAGQMGDLSNAFAEMGIDDFRSYESTIGKLAGGRYADLGIEDAISTALGMAPIFGTVKGLSGLAAAAMGESVIGTFSDPITGIGYHVTESGDINAISPEEGIGYQGSDSGNRDYLEQFNRRNNATYTPENTAGGFDRAGSLSSLIERTLANTTNPGIGDSYFDTLIRGGINSRNAGLGADATQGQFDELFNTDYLGQTILNDETNRLRDVGRAEISKGFPDNAFQSIDDSIIDQIVSERAQPAREQISAFEARGNFNPQGGRTANEAIDFQTSAATDRVREVGQGVLGGYNQGINNIRDRANSAIGDFDLGEDLFQASPFLQERDQFVRDSASGVREGINTALGNEPLFNVGGAIQEGGRSQGVVSGGTGSGNLLDTLASRESLAGANRTKRGLGTRGSGAF